jgi:hypothetical protein
MKYLYIFAFVFLSGCAAHTDSTLWNTPQATTLINPVNRKVVQCKPDSIKPNSENVPFESISQCIEEYKAMGFWVK